MPQTPVTDLVKINTTVAGAQFAPAVCALSGGGYIIVWEDSSAGRIYAQRFSATGQPVGSELQLDSTQGGQALWVSVAATGGDGFVIAFQAGSFAQAEIFAHRYDSANNPSGGLFAVNTTTPNEQYNPHLTALDNGAVLFTWDTQASDVFQEVRGRIYLSDGQALGADFPIAPMSATVENGFSAIAPLPGGGFVVTWQSGTPMGTDNFEIVGQRFTSSGGAIGGVFQVNTSTPNSQYGNDVARLSDGGFVVSWVDAPGNNGGGRILARHYDSSGVAIGGEILIDAKASGGYGRTVLSALADGGYVVGWMEADTADNNVLARAMGANDVSLDVAFEMSFNSPFGANFFSDGAVTLTNGNVVFTWDGPSITPPGGQGTGQDVYMRVYNFAASNAPTEGDDVLTDTSGNDNINALGGNDSVTLTNGRDVVNGGSGTDVLVLDYAAATGGVGNFDGGGIYDGYYSEGSPQVSQRLAAYTGFERFDITTGTGADDITTFGGDDEVRTGAGDDRVNVGGGVNIADGGADVDAIGADLSGLNAGVTVDLGSAVNSGIYGTYSNFEYFGTIIGTGFDDIFVSTSFARIDMIDGGGGNDQITVRNGRDVVAGGSGADTLVIDYIAATGVINAASGPTANPNGGFDGVYSEGNAQVATRLVSYTGIERFIFRLGSADDTLTIVSALDEADGGGGTDTLSGSFAGGPAVDIELATSSRFDDFEAFGSVTGSAFGDRFVTRTGQFNETLTLGDGDDSVTLRNGRDTVAGGFGVDTLVLEYAAATDAVTNSVGPTANPNGGFDGGIYAGSAQVSQRGVDYTGIERFNVTTGSGNDTIATGSGNDTLNLGTGTDTANAGLGRDRLIVDYSAAATVVTMALGPIVNNGQGGYDGRYADGAGNQVTYSSIEDFTISTGSAADSIATGNGEDVISTGGGDDRLNGGAGADVMTGGGGNDIYIVDAGDVLVEAPGGGLDSVFTSVAWTLAAEFERLGVGDFATTYAIDLTGNGVANEMWGNAGANLLDGGGDADIMNGFEGDDTYRVDNVGDIVIELLNQGTDMVLTTVSYTIAHDIERLLVSDAASTGALNLTGNELANQVTGNAGANLIDGGLGADTMTGLAGNDIYIVDNAGDAIVEAANAGLDTVFTTVTTTLADNVDRLGVNGFYTTYAIDLTGNALDNEMWGNEGTNMLDGKAGSDIIRGFGGADTFAFTTALGSGNIDQLVDFTAGTDTIALDDAIFTGLATGALAAAAFRTGTAAADADDRIIYDNLTGALYFDADGNGNGAAIQFATLHEGLSLTASDFTVI